MEPAAHNAPLRPAVVTLYSEYMARKPTRPAPRDSVGNPLPSYMFVDRLDEPTRHKLVLLLERHQPPVAAPDPNFQHVAQLMAHLAIEQVVAARGDLTLRAPGFPRGRQFDRLAQLVLHGDAPLALDAVGAWADTYARLPGLPWLRDEEGSFLAAVEEVLASTIFAVRGREIVKREDLGASLLIDKPLQPLVTANPVLRDVDARLREALDELVAGNAADAVTDAGTALQMLLDHLGYKGAKLGDQLKAARRAGWLSGVDTPLANAIDNLAMWVASVRNQRSDAHHGPPPDPRDAELVVRVVGLLVLRFG
jgi:hypothetical protein